MLMQGDFDLNSKQILNDSHEEVIKQTMLKQDFVFRNQVHELHRLYGVQRSLMNYNGHREDGQFNSWNANAQSFLKTVTNKYEPSAKEARFSSIIKMESTPYMSHEFLDNHQGARHKLQKRPLDLQLSADEFINLGEDKLLKRGNFGNLLKGPLGFGNLVSAGNPLEAEKLNLSLSIGEDKIMTQGKRPWGYNKVHFGPQIVIDLEKSVEEVLNAKGIPSGSSPSSKDMAESQVSALSLPLTSDSMGSCSYIARNSSFQGYSECPREQIHEGMRECHNVDLHMDLPTKTQQSTSYKGRSFDLNKFHLDESSFYSGDPIFTSNSTASSSGVSAGFNGNTNKGNFSATNCNKEYNNCSNKTHNTIQKDHVVNLAVVDLKSDTGSTDIWVTNGSCNGIKDGGVSPKCADSETVPSIGISGNLENCRGSHKKENAELILNVQKGFSHSADHVPADPNMKSVSCEKSEVEDAVFSCIDENQNTNQDGHGIKSPASVKSYAVSDNDSSNVKTTHSGVKTCLFNNYSETQSGTQVADALSSEHDEQISDSSESKSECTNQKQEMHEVDVSMKRAADSLMHIYLDYSACCQDSNEERTSKEMENTPRQKPLCSSDSFELTALNLAERDVDDDAVSSNPYEVNYEETKDFSSKLRRGRRMKDFQREILPNLASLSRHEICEDISILEGVLRSREYRKMRAKMTTHSESWSAPVRSRRSRLNYVRRSNLT